MNEKRSIKMKALFTLSLFCLQLSLLQAIVSEDADFVVKKIQDDKFTLPKEEEEELIRREEIPHHLKKAHIKSHVGDKKKNIPFAPEVTADDIKRQSLEHPIVHAYVSDRPKHVEHKKTIIPAGKNVLYDIHDGPKDSYSEVDHAMSRRFELYPKWFSHKIPPLFGKHFAKRYYHPFGSISSRNHIAKSKVRTSNGAKRNYHMLPESWMHSPEIGHYHHNNHITINELPKEFMEMQPGRIAPMNPPQRGPPLNLANAVGEIVDIPDGGENNGENNGDNNGDNVDDRLDDDIREIPHGLMNHLNSDEYAPNYGNHPDDHWMDYGGLPHGHHHRHEDNPCHHEPCLNGGVCHFVHAVPVYNFKCNCKPNFSGHYCEHTPFSCHPNPCQHDGVCTKTATGFFCTCPQDYKGHDCQIQSACVHNPCLNNGACTETADGFVCQCEKGWSGRNCNEKISLCSTNPCLNGGTCRELEEDRFECLCPNGYGCVDCSCPVAVTSNPAKVVSGIPPAVSPLSMATGSTCPDNACKNGGTCVKSYSGFSCNCPTGFHGMDCSTPDLCNPNPCENSGVCVQDGDENYKCICPYGFKGADCQTPLACSSHPCMNSATCMETPDGFHCKCALGYKGKKCTDLSPCSKNPCYHKANCIEKGSLFTCSCKIGFRGKSCRDKDPCVPNPCGGNGLCAEVNSVVTCNCTRGWMGELCEIENQCQENRCLNGATCVHTLEEFKCVCPDGFHGTNCEYRSPCHTSPCENGGICEATGSTFVCRCGAGYHGGRCHLSSHCHPNPCHNGGRCFDGDEDYICECPHAFTGKLCEERHACVSDPCLNNGHCLEEGDTYRCKCRLGYFGRLCDDYVCEQSPCRNGGTCMPANTDVGFACECVFPYHGHRCDEVDPCVPNPCKNSGTCHSHLQRIRDVNYHLGPVFHGTDENVVSVVGPIHNETVHHAPFYDEASHAVSYLPDAQLQTNEVNHFHLTSDTPSKVYDDQIYNARTEDDSDDSGAHTGHIIDPHKKHEPANRYHVEQYPEEAHFIRRSHHPVDEEEGEKRTFRVPHHHHIIVDEIDGIKRRSKIKQKRILSLHRRHKIIDVVPRVQINVRNKATSQLIKRTIRDLYVCQCSDGFLGAHCQHLNPCRGTPCSNGGTCIPRGDSYQCHCTSGFGGLKCDDPHPCQPNPCNNGGKCVLTKSIHGYQCGCLNGWRGYNCELRDQCSMDNPCEHGGKCVNKLDESVECLCRARFTGDMCEVDKCADCDVEAFCRHGHCVCRNGFIGNGFKCKAMGDVCHPNPCDNKGKCNPGQDGKVFTCDCPTGVVGPRCEYPNPCISSPCLHSGACVDESNSKDKGILMLDRHDYKCFCTQGFRGKDCEETSLAACSSGPCENNGTCFDSSSESHRKHLNHVDDYECFCMKGYTGKNCELNHFACFSDPCLNGGSCLDPDKLPDVSFDAHGYKCNCRAGFTGRNCEVTISGPGACHSDPCQHSGHCVDITNNPDSDIHFDYEHEFKCYCNPQYSGRLCEVPYPACYSMPCLHNGTCIDRTHQPSSLFDDTGYHCECMAGFEGKNCERQYSFASSEEEDAVVHPANGLEDTDSLSPTPLVVFLKQTPIKLHKPTAVISLKQTTSLPTQNEKPKHYKITELEVPELPEDDPTKKVGNPSQLAKKLTEKEIFKKKAPAQDDPKVRKLTGNLFRNPMPTSPILLKKSDSSTFLNFFETPYKNNGGIIRTMEKSATPYDSGKSAAAIGIKKNMLNALPSSVWQRVYDTMSQLYYKNQKSGIMK